MIRIIVDLLGHKVDDITMNIKRINDGSIRLVWHVLFWNLLFLTCCCFYGCFWCCGSVKTVRARINKAYVWLEMYSMYHLLLIQCRKMSWIWWTLFPAVWMRSQEEVHNQRYRPKKITYFCIQNLFFLCEYCLYLNQVFRYRLYKV